ncbi:hypothetical protein [Saccharopolyspora hattusasensis]|uniref:hypothetical protein n=1 Tax=Saccharopolyspora hattusasensis TaxID=1128679 RepID=UPI003D96CD92
MHRTLITVATGRIDRRIVLAVLIGLVGAANLASAFATIFAIVLVARILIGSSLYVSTSNLSITLGALFGGIATTSVLWIGAALAGGEPRRVRKRNV